MTVQESYQKRHPDGTADVAYKVGDSGDLVILFRGNSNNGSKVRPLPLFQRSIAAFARIENALISGAVSPPPLVR